MLLPFGGAGAAARLRLAAIMETPLVVSVRFRRFYDAKKHHV